MQNEEKYPLRLAIETNEKGEKRMQWIKISVYYHHELDEVCELSYCGRMEATLPYTTLLELQAGNQTALEMLDHDINIGAQILHKDILRICGTDLPIMGAMVVADSAPSDFENLEWQIYANLNPTPGDMIMDSDGRTNVLMTTYWIQPDGHLHRDPKYTNRCSASKKCKLH
jgi:hypothetical protein